MMYRGWYKGVREFGSARVPWELCFAEWNAQFFGDKAYQLTDLEKQSLRWEAEKFRSGQVWHRWDYPRNAVESPDLELRNEILGRYLTENIRAFRTWGLSAFCPWDHGLFWKLRDGADRSRKNLKTDWDSLQKPGFSPDYVEDQMAWMNTSYQRADWLPTVAAEALYRNNLPLLAYIGGKSAAFTSKDHNFLSGDTIEKQLIVINNSRERLTGKCNWSLQIPKPLSSRHQIVLEPGQQIRVPITFKLPPGTPAGAYALQAEVAFSTGEVQKDNFQIDVFPGPGTANGKSKIALFDPKGQSTKLLSQLHIDFTPVQASSDLSGYELLLVGKEALSPDAPAPDIAHVRDGLKVLLFEQTSETLEQRFGFRVEEYGLRNVFSRVPDHPALAGLSNDHLANWCGEATLLSPTLRYEIGQRHAPEVKWCGIPVTRLWRAGNRGNVASVLIEKPACGDFLPVLDGGFALQFTPLLEFHEGKGLVIFCQMDVTGRTETDPAAEGLVRNLVQYASTWKPAPGRQLIYAGDDAGRRFLEQAGFSSAVYSAEKLSDGHVLVVCPGGAQPLTSEKARIADFLNSGGKVVAVGLGEKDAASFLPGQISIKSAEHVSAWFQPPHRTSPFAGVSPADVHNRDPRALPLVDSGATTLGDGVLASSANGNIVFCQIAPWQFAGSDQNNLRRTYRRAAFLLTRILANTGAISTTPVLDRFHNPAAKNETRWLEGLYADKPQEWDDPYRFFCW